MAACDAMRDEDDVVVRNAVPDDIQIYRNMTLETGEKMLGEVVERYQNGNYKVRAVKRFPYRGKMRLATLIGVILPKDIDENNMIKSGNFYEYRVNVFR